MRGAAALLLLAVGLGACAAAGADSASSLTVSQPISESVTLEVAGADRSYDLFVPGGVALPMALVLDLHGLTGTPATQDLLSGMQAVAAAEGFAVAQPAGTAGAWDAFSSREGDLAFLRAVVDDVAGRVEVDRGRVYATGMSNGGGMVHRLGCDAADVFAAIAPVAGAHLLDATCDPSRPVAVLAFHGTDDRIVPYDGAGTALPSIETWAAAWAERNGCDGDAVPSRVAADLRLLVWQGCPEDGEVELVVVEGGGHGWPGTADPRRREATTDSIDATARLWEFFAAHARG